MEQTTLEERLREMEARAAGAAGESRAPSQVIRARLSAMRSVEPDVELVYTIADPWTRRLFVALCRRYGLRPYRRPRQRRTTVQIAAPKTFVDELLWPQFEALAQELIAHLTEVTERVLGQVVCDDASEVEEVGT